MSAFSGSSNLSAALQGTLQSKEPATVPDQVNRGLGVSTIETPSASSRNATLQELSWRLQQSIRLTGVAIALDQGDSVVCVASSGPAAPPLGTVLDRSRGLSAECLRARETRVSNDTWKDPRVNREACRRSGVRSTVVVPLLLDGEVIGILGVYSDRPAYFTERQVFLLEFIASFVTRAAAGVLAPQVSPPPVHQPRLPAIAEAEQEKSEEAGEIEKPPLQVAVPLQNEGRWKRWVTFAAGIVLIAAAGAFFLRRTGTRFSILSPPAANTPESASSKPGGLPQLGGSSGNQSHVLGTGPSIAESLQHWSAPGYTRVTIRLDQERQVHCERLPNPERLYCDLPDLRVPREYSGQEYNDDPLLAGVRVGQYRPNIARVVFDLKSATVRHAVATLSGPPRLMVEIMELTKMGIGDSSSAALANDPSSLSSPGKAAGKIPFTIVIDPGHGGRDTGTIGWAGLQEKDLVLDVARRLGKMLQAKLGAQVILTRTTDTFLPLEARSRIANQAGASLFLSIHGNGSDYAPAEGIETYYLGESGSAKDAHVAEAENKLASDAHSPEWQLAAHATLGIAADSQQLAQDVQEALYKAASQEGHARNRGVRTAPFVVLRDAQMPAILAEISFLSSRAEERKLMRADHRQALAEGLFQGIAAHLARRLRAKPGQNSAALAPMVGAH